MILEAPFTGTDPVPIRNLLGYSWFANKYGLTLDSVLEYELVLPNATITTVTATQHPDIFFGLKGGFLNFVSTYLPGVSGSLAQFFQI